MPDVNGNGFFLSLFRGIFFLSILLSLAAFSFFFQFFYITGCRGTQESFQRHSIPLLVPLQIQLPHQPVVVKRCCAAFFYLFLSSLHLPQRSLSSFLFAVQHKCGA